MRAARRGSTAAGLALLAALCPALLASAQATSYGSLHASDATLRAGCHAYHYRYAVSPPTRDWVLETRLRDPRGRGRGYGYFQAGGNPTHGRPAFRICSADVVPGRFTITGSLHWYDDPVVPVMPATEHTVRLEPAHFRLCRG